ncbi:MliC family protein [Desulfobulbus alkaliphilus]|uniref:MliC family protein n=1 Tax=Desulfobulbus alkaliphilus TaxID=869814 RepID=UPI001964D497|nr:MliC family protein [Desulfobulbus alkaliphilus]MBM9535861.1 MliC family protein [Desulfobulbus alkaliphilus]
MKTLIAATMVTLLAAGCTSTPSISTSSTEVQEVRFNCTDGQSLAVRFFPAQGVAVLVRNRETMELHEQVSGSGFIYSDGSTAIRGKSNDLTVEIGDQVPLRCMAL